MTATEQRELELSVAMALNSARRAYGLRRLTVSALLVRAGEAHARALALAGQFTHSWPDGRPFGTWVQGFFPVRPYRLWSAGETLLWVTPSLTPDYAAQAWLASAEHRRILLTPSWRQLGVGVVRVQNGPGLYSGKDVTIAAAEFGLRR